MAQPTSYPDWATNLINESGYGENRIEPPQQIKDSGILGEEPMSRVFLNYQLWLAGEWIRHLEDEVESLKSRVTTLEGGA